MRLGFHEIGAHLKNNLAPVYVVTGDEPLQLGEAADLIRATAQSKGYSERKILDAGTGFDWYELTAESNSLSLFADQRILDLRIPNGKPGAPGSKALVAYCENIPADTILLITMPKLDQSQTKSKWYKALDNAGAVIQIWPVAEQRLPPWIEQRMRQKGLIPEPDVINMLAERIEGNLLAAAQEIEKLLLLNGPGIITAEQLTACVTDSARYDVFGLVDAALEGKPNRCVKIIQGLRNEGLASTIILWALAREIRQMSQIAYAIKNGTPMHMAFSEFRIWDKRKPIVTQGLKRLSQSQWNNLLVDCETADEAIKGRNKKDSWLLLEEISIRMAGLTIHSEAC